MEYTEEEKAQFKREFAVRRKRQLMLAIPLLPLFVVVTLTGRGSQEVFGIPRQTFGMGFFVLVVCGLLFSFRNWRCPACDKYLGKGVRSYCPRCGVELQ
jgi:hypothetical protein